MKRRILALALTAALVSALSLPAAAADNTASADTATASESQMLPDSVLTMEKSARFTGMTTER